MFGSILFGGLPYVIFAAVVLFLLRGRPASAYRRASLVAPAVFGVLLVAGFAVVRFWSTPGAELSAEVDPAIDALTLVLGVAYSYAAFANCGYWLLLRFGLLENPPDA